MWVPECEVFAKNMSYPIGGLRWNRSDANLAKSIDGPNACRGDYAYSLRNLGNQRRTAVQRSSAKMKLRTLTSIKTRWTKKLGALAGLVTREE